MPDRGRTGRGPRRRRGRRGRGRDLSLAAVEAALAALLPAPVAWSCVPVADHTDTLFDDERALTARFVPRRLATFSSGRLAARRALGVSVPIAIAVDGAPAAPQGWRLSISHTDDLAVAIACPSGAAAGLGVDIEDVRRMDPKLRRHVIGPLDRLTEDAGPEMLTATFSLRESLFKALPDADPAEIFVRWAGDAVDAGMGEGTLGYGWRRAGDYVVSFALLPPFPAAQW